MRVLVDLPRPIFVSKNGFAVAPTDDQIRRSNVLLEAGMRSVFESDLDLAASTDFRHELHFQHLALRARVFAVGVQPSDLERGALHMRGISGREPDLKPARPLGPAVAGLSETRSG
jgi:hypothetical protein